MKTKLIFILALTLLINITYAKRTAMLIGVQNYKSFASLEACHGDVDAMKELLKQGGFQDDHIWAMKDAGYGEMLTASDLFSNVTAFARGIQKGDEVVFFFSGHGIGGSDGKNYLLGADGNIDNPEKYGSISVEDIKQILKEKNPSEVVMIVDACRNFVKKEGKGSGEKISAKMNTGKGIKVSSTIGTEPVSQSKKSDKTIVKTIYAASEGQQSFERKDKGKGAFTYYMTYMNDSPNSALDIDMSKDGVITIEDLVQFADNRLGDYTKSQGLPAMNPVYQTEGGITYEPFMLFRYNAEKVVAEQKKEGSKPIFKYDEKAELEKIKKFTENKEYLKEELPVYQPKVVQDKSIKVDDTDLSSWKLAMAQEDEIKKAKTEEERRAAEAREKERVYNELKSKYNTVIAEMDKTEDIFVKHEKLEKLRNEVNAVKYPEVKQKILPLLEPVYQKIKEVKDQKQSNLDNLRIQFEKDILDMEEMQSSSLSDELKEKYLEGFKKKWADYVKIQKDEELGKKYDNLILLLFGFPLKSIEEKMRDSQLSDDIKLKLLEEFETKWQDYVKLQKDEELRKRLNNLFVMLFEFPLKSIEEKIRDSHISDELKTKYLEEFKNKWDDNLKIQKANKQGKRYKNLFIEKQIKSTVSGINLLLIYSGTFNREGSNVTVSDFYIGKTEVTQAQYQAVMGTNPSYFKGDRKPVESVTWDDAVEYCNELSKKEGLQKCYRGSGDNIVCNFEANGYRLPTEAEWEFAARGGSISRGYEYSGSDNIDDVAWYSEAHWGSLGSTKSVGTKKPNELGIYDMSGNILEWCNDWYGNYPSGSLTNPTGASSGSYHVPRGGGWHSDAGGCNIASRVRFNDALSDSYYDRIFGFRVVRLP